MNWSDEFAGAQPIGVASLLKLGLEPDVVETLERGSYVGEFRLVRLLGEGGFGAVYLAEQRNPHRLVALKVMKPLMDAEEFLRRFEVERQILTRMDHKYVPEIYVGGETDSGRPFFAMQLVHGVHITEYCDRACLGIRQRLDLFLKVLGAVQHAHHVPIAHLDIKPSNVLVTVPYFLPGDILDLPAFSQRLLSRRDRISTFLWERLPATLQQWLADPPSLLASPEAIEDKVLRCLNEAIAGESIHELVAPDGVTLREETARLLAGRPSGRELACLNRFLLEDSFPTEFSRVPNDILTPSIKFIDFGISAATQARDSSQASTFTLQFKTPAYMSPEQADSARFGLPDTRSDIYSLGVLLYELMAGSTPVSNTTALTQTAITAVSAVCDTVPPPPSMALKLRPLHEQNRVGKARSLHPGNFSNLISPELDWIVMKALEKRPELRHKTPEAFSNRIAEHLGRKPVKGYSSGPFYSFRQLLVRRWERFVAGGLIGILATGIGYHYWQRPGFVHVDGEPNDAQVLVDGEAYSVGRLPTVLRLPNGHHKVTFRHSNHTDEERVVMVPRGGETTINYVRLQHEKGTLNVDGFPSAAGIQFAGVSYYSEIKELKADTGTNELVAFADNHFDVRKTVMIGKEQNTGVRFSLERGVDWTYRSTGISGKFFSVLSNTIPGGLPVIALSHLDGLVVLDSLSGTYLGTVPTSDGNARTWVQLEQPDAGGLIISGVNRPNEGLFVEAFHPGWPTSVVWSNHFITRPTSFGDATAPFIMELRNTNGVAAIAIAGRDAHVHILDAADGRERQDFFLTDRDGVHTPDLRAWTSNGRTYLSAVFTRDKTIAGNAATNQAEAVCIDVFTKARLWEIEFAEGTKALFLYSHGNETPLILAWNETAWRIVDSSSGRAKTQGLLPGEVSGFPLLSSAGAESGYNVLFHFRNALSPLRAVRLSDGSCIWEGPTNVAMNQFADPGFIIPQTADGKVLVTTEDALLALDATTGAERWRFGGEIRSVQTDSSRTNIYVGLKGRGLFCLDSNGGTNWMLRLSISDELHGISPVGFDTTSDGLLIHYKGALLHAHSPRLLWSVKADAQLEADPLIATGARDNPIVIQNGSWSRTVNLRAFDGRDGSTVWSAPVKIQPNRAPVLAKLDGPDLLEVVATGALSMPQQGHHLLIIRATDGQVIRSPSINVPGWTACTPAVADFRGNGSLDVAVSTYTSPQVALLDGRSGNLFGEQTNVAMSLGGLETADIDGDGLPDLVVASFGGIYALRGSDGKLFWATPTNEVPDQYASCSRPVIGDLDGDGKREVVLTSVQGGLFVLDARTGRPLWSPRINEGGQQTFKVAGHASIAEVDGRRVIVAPTGDAGVVAFDWQARSELWRSPRGHPVSASPKIVDLAHEGNRQVVVATRYGEVFVLNLGDGKLRWATRLGQESIAAAPACIDLDGDGVDDLVFACLDDWLYAINGRTISLGWLKH